MVYRKPYNYDQVLRRGPCLIIYLLPSLDKMLEPEANDLRPAICLLFYQRHGRKNKWHRNGLGVFLVFYPGGVEVHVARGGRVRHLSPVDLAVEAPPLRQRPAVQLAHLPLPAASMTNHASSQSRWAFQPANSIGPPEKPSADDVGGRRVRPVIADRVGCGLLPGGVEVEP